MFNCLVKQFLLLRFILSKNSVFRVTIVVIVFAGFFLTIEVGNASANNLGCTTSTSLESLMRWSNLTGHETLCKMR